MPRPTFELSDGHAVWSVDRVPPTQQQLTSFLEAHRQALVSLEINVDHGREYPPLDFEKIGVLPSLTSLILSGLTLNAVAFTTANTPALQHLDVGFLSCTAEDGLRFELALPELETLKAEYVMVTGQCDFGLCLSRCPKLKSVQGYKFRYLSGDNYCVLPQCESLILYRSECTGHLDIIAAPKLLELSVEASFDLKHVRLWDLEHEVVAQDVERLTAELGRVMKEIADDVNRWGEKWKDGTFGGQEAYERNWIREEDVEKFDFKTHDYAEEFVGESMHDMFERRREEAKGKVWQAFVANIEQRPKVSRREGLPRCSVNCVNMGLSRESMAHFKANGRVDLVESEDDDGYDDMDLFF